MNFSGMRRDKTKGGSVRRSQIITTHGCGAIVDLAGWSVIIAGLPYWDISVENRIYEENLQIYLGVKFFVLPPESIDEFGRDNGRGIKSFIFPEWMYCPKCKRLAKHKDFNYTGKPQCTVCKQALVPSRFVVACENGHLEDFPYDRWVHRGEKCRGRSELYIEMSEKSAGLESIIIKCKSCNSSRSMAESFNKKEISNIVKCLGNRPWLNDKELGRCEKPLRTVQRGATNLHLNITVSALSIPPWSQKIQMHYSNVHIWNQICDFIDEPDLFKKLVEKWGWTQTLNCSYKELLEQAKLKKGYASSEKSITWNDLLFDEYRSFITGCDDESGEFRTESAEVPPILLGYVDQVILGTRIREVMALCGFKRLNFDYDLSDASSFTKLGREYSEWLPGVEMKGEGIFIRLNSEKIQEWENKESVMSRYSRVIRKTKEQKSDDNRQESRIYLLHTFAHLLIRQLVLQCGYSSTAIKERIYCSCDKAGDGEKSMCGFLLYTATSDSEGSLGGLVREGYVNRLENTIRNMLESASWCSADPICIQSEGQGLNATNFAACFSCALLPETSCELKNCYLDRASVTGTLDDRDIGYFGNLFLQEH